MASFEEILEKALKGARDYPGVSLRELATTDSRGPNLGPPGASSTQFSQVATPAVRFFPMRDRSFRFEG